MFNSVTAEKLRSLPPVEGVESDRLPQVLSKVYAHILSLKTKYQEGELGFVAEEIESDHKALRDMAFTLEVYLESGKFDADKEAIAFVAAMSHKLMASLKTHEKTTLTLDEVPSEIVTVLLFLIGGYFADAEEAVQNIKQDEGDSEACRLLKQHIGFLVKGRLNGLINSSLGEPSHEPLERRAADLMWQNLSKGIKVLAAALLGRTNDKYQSFYQSVLELAISYDEDNGIRYVCSGPYRLARLLMMASDVLMQHSVVNVAKEYLKGEQYFDFLYRIADKRPFLWENHLDAIRKGFLLNNVSSVVTFPTGAGKSTLVELKIVQAVADGGRVLYIVPTHALENQVKSNMTALLGSDEYRNLNIGREFSMEEEGDQPVMVMTPERCSTLLALSPEYFDGVTLVMMDEFHIISNSTHRSLGAMYCLISLFSLLPDSIYVLVSAMVENGEEIADWISSVTGRQCLNLSMKWKPTSQLQGCVVYMNKEAKELQALCDAEKLSGKKNPSQKLKDSLKASPYCLFSLCNTWESNKAKDYYLVPLLDYKVNLGAGSYWNLIGNRNEVSLELAKKFASLGMKTIIFVENPSQANSAVKKLNGEQIPKELTPVQKRRLDSIAEELGGAEFSYVNDPMSAVQHHGLLLNEERIIMENLFRTSIDIMVATPTLAQGVNLPVDVVLMAGEDRFDSETKRRSKLQAHEILNAAGRAGRAGFRSQGAAILVSNNVIAVDGNKLDDSWFRLKNDIFSKGDQCLKVEDPFASLSETPDGDEDEITTEQKLVLMKLNLQGEDKRKVIARSFRAYQLQKEQQPVDSFIDKIITLSAGYNKIDMPLIELSFKSGIDQEVLSSFYEWIEANDLVDDSVVGMLKYYCNWLVTSPASLGRLLVYESTWAELLEMLQAKDEHDGTAIERLCQILQMYLSGKTLRDISDLLVHKRGEIFIGNARRFILKMLPELSYAFSVLSMVYVQYLKDHDEPDILIPSSVKNFATCLKEGVTSEEMLRLKTDQHLMRVEAFRIFNEKK